MLSLFLLISYFFYLWIESVPSRTERGQTAETDVGSQAEEDATTCPVNNCAVSLETGKKRCPPNGDRIEKRAGEVCSLPFQCSNPSLPYALWNDGSVNMQGNCPPGVACDCLASVHCPNYIASSWYLSRGNISVLNSRDLQSRPLLNQHAPPPQQVPSGEYCMVPYNWTIFGIPGCPATSSDDVSYADIQNCMQLETKGYAACLSGTLAYVPENLNQFNKDRYRQIPLGCVVGNREDCPGGVKVWDNQSGSITCRYDST